MGRLVAVRARACTFMHMRMCMYVSCDPHAGAPSVLTAETKRQHKKVLMKHVTRRAQPGGCRGWRGRVEPVPDLVRYVEVQW